MALESHQHWTHLQPMTAPRAESSKQSPIRRAVNGSGFSQRPLRRVERPTRRPSPPPMVEVRTLSTEMPGPLFTADNSTSTDPAAPDRRCDATGGPSWTDSTKWKSSTLPNQWHGASIHRNFRGAGLLRTSGILTQRLPADLGSLSHVELLEAASSRLTGTSPPEPASLTDFAAPLLHIHSLAANLSASLTNVRRPHPILFQNNPGCAPQPL